MRLIYIVATAILLLSGRGQAADNSTVQGKTNTGILEGLVLDDPDKSPVAWAWITLVPAGPYSPGSELRPAQAISSQDGSFVLGGLTPGWYEVRARHVGYTSPAPDRIRILPGGRARVDLSLVRRLHVQNPIVVSAPRVPVRRNQLERALDADHMPRLGGLLNDPLRVVAASPGADTRSDYDGRVSVRGASPFETGFSLDGFPVPFAYHLGGAVSIFDPEAIDEIRFYTGGFPATEGPGSSGIVAVSSRFGAGERRRRIELSPVALSGSLSESRFDNRLYLFASLRATYHDLVLKALDARPGTTVPNFSDGRLNATWNFSPGQRIGLRLFRSSDSMRMGLVAGETNEVHISGDLVRAALVWDGDWLAGPNSGAGGTLALAWQPCEYDMRVYGSDNESMDWDAEAFYIRASARLVYGGHRAEAGGVRGLQTTRYSVNMARGFWNAWSGSPGEATIAADPVTLKQRGAKDTGTLSAWLQDRWTAGAHWTVTAGLRLDTFDVTHESFLDPRLSVEWADDFFSIYAATGVYHAHPLDNVGDPTALGDGVKTRRAEHRVLGIRQFIGPWGELHGEVFERRTTSLVSETEPGLFESTGVGWASGAELTWSKTDPGWQADVSWSFGRSMRWDPAGPIVKTAEPVGEEDYTASLTHSSRKWYTSPFDPGHGLRLHTGLKPTSSTYVGMTWQYRTGSATTPVQDIIVDGSGRVFGIEGLPGSARLPAFHRLDFRAEQSWRNGWGQWRAFIDISNLYNHANVFQASYDKSYTQRNEYRMLPVIPSAGIALEF